MRKEVRVEGSEGRGGRILGEWHRVQEEEREGVGSLRAWRGQGRCFSKVSPHCFVLHDP